MTEMKWTILTVTDPITAEMYKGLLESSEIPVILRSNATPTVHPFTVGFLGDVEVLVLKDSLSDAQALIEEIDVSEEEFFDEIDAPEND